MMDFVVFTNLCTVMLWKLLQNFSIVDMIVMIFVWQAEKYSLTEIMVTFSVYLKILMGG